MKKIVLPVGAFFMLGVQTIAGMDQRQAIALWDVGMQAAVQHYRPSEEDSPSYTPKDIAHAQQYGTLRAKPFKRCGSPSVAWLQEAVFPYSPLIRCTEEKIKVDMRPYEVHISQLMAQGMSYTYPFLMGVFLGPYSWISARYFVGIFQKDDSEKSVAGSKEFPFARFLANYATKPGTRKKVVVRYSNEHYEISPKETGSPKEIKADLIEKLLPLLDVSYKVGQCTLHTNESKKSVIDITLDTRRLDEKIAANITRWYQKPFVAACLQYLLLGTGATLTFIFPVSWGMSIPIGSFLLYTYVSSSSKRQDECTHFKSKKNKNSPFTTALNASPLIRKGVVNYIRSALAQAQKRH